MAGSKKDTFENGLLALIFKNTALSGIGSGISATTTAGSLYIALYKVAPTDSTQGTECDYTGYARVAVARSAAGWTVTNNVASNAAVITFAACTAGSNTAVAFAICKAGTAGVDDAIYWGDITDPSGGLAISAGITPEIAIGACTITED